MGSSDKRSEHASNAGQWLVNVADDVVVPMTTLEVIDGLRKDRLSEQSLVWRIGMHDWTSIGDVPQLRLAVGSRPPPPAAPRLFTPVPSVAAPLTQQPAQSTMPNSLAPTTAEADAGDGVRAPGAWAEFDELLANERRADQRSSRRAVLLAALSAAALAATFALWLLRSPAPQAAQAPAQAARASEVPARAATLEALAAPSASLEPRAAAAPGLASKSVAPFLARRTKPTTSAASSSQTPVESQATAPAPDSTDTAPGVSVVPLAPLEPAPAATVAPEATPAPIAPIAPDNP
ncbi:MAG: GYF domain-containing protein [Pseudomonadota bacterium]